MNDETTEILKTFRAYSDTFKQKKAIALLPFIGLFLTIQKLSKQGYSYSQLHELEVKQLRHNLAIVSGTATRHKENHEILDEFGFTYTLRKIPKGWKIIVGVIHDRAGFLSSVLRKLKAILFYFLVYCFN
jgi:hypothetical protein